MAKERPRKKSRSTADDYLFLPQANEKQNMGEWEGKRERERERERQQEERTTVKLMILGVVLVVSCTCMLQYLRMLLRLFSCSSRLES